MDTCCCTDTPPPDCPICVEGDNVLVDSYPGFVIDGESGFAGVTDSTELFVIPNGCVTDGHSTACFDVLSIAWNLAQIGVGHVGETCVDYFGNAIACDAVVCWWLAVNYVVCPNSCTIGPDSVCAGGSRGNDELKAMIVVDASSDPDYVLLIVQVTSNWGRFHCCIDGEPGTGAHPIYQMRVYYRVSKDAFTCLCPLCFEKYDEQLILGEFVPCLNFPDNLKVNVRGINATQQQQNDAALRCSSADYGYGVGGAGCYGGGGETCGTAACSYTADEDLHWILNSGTCITGCRCPNHDELIAAGKSLPRYVGQGLTISTDCIAGANDCGGIGCQYSAYDSEGTQGGSVGPWSWGGCVDVPCPAGCYFPGPPSVPPTGPSDTFSAVCTSP